MSDRKTLGSWAFAEDLFVEACREAPGVAAAPTKKWPNNQTGSRTANSNRTMVPAIRPCRRGGIKAGALRRGFKIQNVNLRNIGSFRRGRLDGGRGNLSPTCRGVAMSTFKPR